MIFVTVGAQLPFDRLVRKLDEIQPILNLDIFAQIGQGTYIPRNFQFVSLLTKDEYLDKLTQSNLVISHAGMGNILSSLTAGKKIIIVPRLVEFKEHRNNHQNDTCNEMKHIDGVTVCDELELLLDTIQQTILRKFDKKLSHYANDGVISKLREEING